MSDIKLDVPDLKVIVDKAGAWDVVLQEETYKTFIQSPEKYLVNLSQAETTAIGLPLSAVFAISASYALTSSYASGGNGSYTGSFYGDGTNITNVQTASYALNAFPYTGSAEITGSLEVIGTFQVGTPVSSSILYVSESGLVGINMNNPQYALHVSGAVFATDDVTAFSDRRVKTDIHPIYNGLHLISRLQGVTYKRIDNDDGRTHVGFIAQDVKDVIPEVVVGTEEGGYGVSYGNITAVLVEAIKELQLRIVELESNR